MKIAAVVALLICALASSACTTSKPREASPVQRILMTEDLLTPGDRVRLVTDDETIDDFRVTASGVERGIVTGRDEQVPIAEIVAVKTREMSAGKTALLVGGVGYSVIAIMPIIAAPAVLSGGG